MAAGRAKVPKKMCIRCGQVFPLSDFYPHKSWSEQSHRDAWCKECAAKYCYSAETLKQYCYENNRGWEDSFYESAMKKAQYILATDEDYLNPRASAKKREELAGRQAAKCFFSFMNMTSFYRYVPNNGAGTDGVPMPDGGQDSDAVQPGKRTYNKKWRGYFTPEEVESLEEIYEQYEKDFVLDNVNIRDYAMKVSKASLNADIAEDRMRRGEISAGEYKEAQKIFDELSKSSNFAACKRKPGESSGMGSLGEIIVAIEGTGKIKTGQYKWPVDEVDLVLKEYLHTLEAIESEGGFA